MYAERGAPLEHDNDITLLAWAHAAELSLYLDERDSPRTPMRGSRRWPAQHRRRLRLALGPVDAYLAMAAAATGERDLACGGMPTCRGPLAEAWDIPLFWSPGFWPVRPVEQYGY